ncbi:hypothetical protein D515_04073 [Grimontia indica]|uniref:Uncharacterized protein n=1 Tax=Grimontia indica TaxID=1056512 RepID=R1IUK0_9GAMM|nr:hypothetical protein D515_04073 [Grimontia indica]
MSDFLSTLNVSVIWWHNVLNIKELTFRNVLLLPIATQVSVV